MSKNGTSTSESLLERSHVIFWIKRPDLKGRASFAIIRRLKGADGKVLSEETIQNDRLIALNTQLKSGTLDLTSVDKLVEQLKDELNAEQERREDPGSLLKQIWNCSISIGRKDMAIQKSCRQRGKDTH
jgi:hypothetical protein